MFILLKAVQMMTALSQLPYFGGKSVFKLSLLAENSMNRWRWITNTIVQSLTFSRLKKKKEQNWKEKKKEQKHTQKTHILSCFVKLKLFVCYWSIFQICLFVICNYSWK